MLYSMKSVLTGAHLFTLVLTSSEYPVTIEVLYFYFHPDMCRRHKPQPLKFKDNINNIVDNINKWFRDNSLSLNFDKTYILQFRPKNSHEINVKISCNNKLITETKNTKFLGLDIDSSLSWKTRINQMMFKLSRACYTIRYVKHFMSQDTLMKIYFSYFHSIVSYGIIFWGNSAYSSNIFIIHKE